MLGLFRVLQDDVRVRGGIHVHGGVHWRLLEYVQGIDRRGRRSELPLVHRRLDGNGWRLASEDHLPERRRRSVRRGVLDGGEGVQGPGAFARAPRSGATSLSRTRPLAPRPPPPCVRAIAPQ